MCVCFILFTKHAHTQVYSKHWVEVITINPAESEDTGAAPKGLFPFSHLSLWESRPAGPVLRHCGPGGEGLTALTQSISTFVSDQLDRVATLHETLCSSYPAGTKWGFHTSGSITHGTISSKTFWCCRSFTGPTNSTRTR